MWRLGRPGSGRPSFDGGPGDLKAGGDLADRPAILDDETPDDQAMTGRERSIRMGHDRALVE